MFTSRCIVLSQSLLANHILKQGTNVARLGYIAQESEMKQSGLQK